LPTASTSG
jgi:hypothetical protein